MCTNIYEVKTICKLLMSTKYLQSKLRDAAVTPTFILFFMKTGRNKTNLIMHSPAALLYFIVRPFFFAYIKDKPTNIHTTKQFPAEMDCLIILRDLINERTQTNR